MNQPQRDVHDEAHSEHQMRHPDSEPMAPQSDPEPTARQSERESMARQSERESMARQSEREPMARQSEPESMTRPAEPTQAPSRAETAGGGDVAWHEAEGYRQRFMQVQAEFIDDPKAAVEHAGSLVKEAVDRLVDSAHHQSGGGGEADTERLRVTLQRYRDLMDNVAGRSR